MYLLCTFASLFIGFIMFMAKGGHFSFLWSLSVCCSISLSIPLWIKTVKAVKIKIYLLIFTYYSHNSFNFTPKELLRHACWDVLKAHATCAVGFHGLIKPTIPHRICDVLVVFILKSEKWINTQSHVNVIRNLWRKSKWNFISQPEIRLRLTTKIFSKFRMYLTPLILYSLKQL